MRPWLRLIITLAAFVLVALGVCAWWNREDLACQWRAYRVGAAEDSEQAQAEIAWFETGPDRDARLRRLAGKWGTGNPQFDLYLASYARHPESTEALREAFSLEFAWREELLDRWAHFWCWESAEGPREEIVRLASYLDVLGSASPPRSITWRQVLDLQAAMTLTGLPQLAKRLKPDDWQGRYQQWRAARSLDGLQFARPERPLPDGAPDTSPTR